MGSNSSKPPAPTPEELEDEKLDDLARFTNVKSVKAYFFMEQALHNESFCIGTPLQDGQSHFFAIYDGHGANGLEASQAVNDYIYTGIEQSSAKVAQLGSSKETKQFLKERFAEAEERMKNSFIDYSYSGTCCLAAFIRKAQLYIANVGNSKAMIYTSQRGKSEAIVLSKSHTLENPEEKARLIKAGAEIKKVEVDGAPLGPDRVWFPYYKEEKYGITITRAVGDFEAKKKGMSSDIEWNVFNLMEGDQFIVLGSDGLWDVMSPDEVATFLVERDGSRLSDKDMAEILVSHAKEKWEQRFEKEGKLVIGNALRTGDDVKSDDITAIVIYLRFADL